MSNNPNSHNYSSGRIRRAQNSDAQKAQAPQPGARRASPAGSVEDLFNSGGQNSRPAQPVQNRQSLFDYDQAPPRQTEAPDDLFGNSEQAAGHGLEYDEQPAAQQRGGHSSSSQSFFDYDASPSRGRGSQPRGGQDAYGGGNAPRRRPMEQQLVQVDTGRGREEARQGAAPQRDDDMPGAERGRPRPNPAVVKKKKRWPKVLISLAVVLCLLGGAVFAASRYIGDILDPGVFGKIIPGLGGEPTAYSKKDVVHILIIGIDYEEGREYTEGLGLTDMILYARYDLKNNQLSLLQIPRDSYVGDSLPTGGTGKINALLISGEDKSNPINNLAQSIQNQFKLPLDHYVAMDMDALKAIVDTFGGIRVYVPRTMEYQGSYLEEGWQWLDGDAAEFFVRNRHGVGFERGDIDRLDNQRHFYSALFRRFLNLAPRDVMNLLPVFDHYCNTDISLGDMIGIGVAGLNLKAENVIFAKAPGATGPELDPSGAGRSLYFLDLYGRGTEEDPGLANLLNQYFRDPEHPVQASEMGLPQITIPAGYALYPPNVQGMADVQGPEGGAEVDVEPQG